MIIVNIQNIKNSSSGVENLRWPSLCSPKAVLVGAGRQEHRSEMKTQQDLAKRLVLVGCIHLKTIASQKKESDCDINY